MNIPKQGTIEYFEIRRRQLNDVYEQIKPLHKELSEFFSPWTARFELSEIDMVKSAKKIIDSIPFECRRNFRSGMMTGITSEADNWFRLSIFGQTDNSDDTVRKYLWNVEQLFRSILSASGFYNIQPQIYDDFGVYGLAAYLINENFDTVANFIKIPVGSFRYSKNAQNKIDTFVRKYQLTALDIYKTYGEENVSENVLKAIKDKNFNKKITLIHFVEPNENYDKKLPWAKNKKYISVIYELSEKDKILEKSGYDYMPYVVYEGADNGENNYPVDSCGINALPDLKQTFSMIKDKMTAIRKKVKPPLKGPANIKRRTSEAISEYYETQTGTEGISTAYEVNIQLNELFQEISEHKDTIKKHFFNDLFAMIINVQDKGQRTAFEISELKEEKVTLIAPALGQVHQALNDLFDVLFIICNNGHLLPEPPEDIVGKEIKVELVSSLAQAQKAGKLAGIERYLTLTSNIASTVEPYAKNKVDWFKLLDLYADYGNVPPDIQVSTKNVLVQKQQEIAQAQKQQEQTQMMQALEQGSKVVDNLGGKDLVANALAERFGM